MRCYILTDNDTRKEFEILFGQAPNLKPVYILDEQSFAMLAPNKEDILFVLAELRWDAADLPSSFLGFELIKRIRYNRQWLNPIVICSYLPKSKFLSQPESLFRVLNLPHSHAFFQLFFEENTIAQLFSADSILRPLTPNQLKDFIYHFYQTKGLLEEELHKLKDQIESKGSLALDEFFNHIRSLIPDSAAPFLSPLKNELQNNLEKEPNKALSLVSSLKPRLLELLPFETQEAPIKIQAPWQVLFIDDNPSIRKQVKKRLKAYGLSCITVDSGEAAFRILENDAKGLLPRPKNSGYWPVHSITVLISDLRLLYPESDEWQPLQGYDIIEQVFENHSHLLSFFILTSKKTGIYQEYAQSKVRIQWFAKEDVLQDSASNRVFNSFFRQIERAGNNIEAILCSIPTASTWNNPYQKKIIHPLKTYYRYHRLSADYYERENQMNVAAFNFIEDVLNKKSSFTKYQFQAGQANLPESPGEMEKFRTKLIGRRIALGLHVKGYSLERIQEEMRGEVAADNGRQFFSTYLSLSINLESMIPDTLLVEEKFFLEQFIQYPINLSASPFLKELGQQLSKIRAEFSKKHGFAVVSPLTIGRYEQVEETIKDLRELAAKAGFVSARNSFLKEIKTVLQEFLTKEKYSNAARASQLSKIYAELTTELSEAV